MPIGSGKGSGIKVLCDDQADAEYVEHHIRVNRMKQFPLTLQELHQAIARETARLSYPGSMSRGRKPVVRKGTKRKVEVFFVNSFHMAELWSTIDQISADQDRFDAWHVAQSNALSRHMERTNCIANRQNNPFPIAAKFLNTFLHQLMKYRHFQPLWPRLHLPLDSRVLGALDRYRLEYRTAQGIQTILGGKSAYSISKEQYNEVQTTLFDLLVELNQRQEAEFTLTSRIELNYLWL